MTDLKKEYKRQFELNYFIYDTLNAIAGILPHFMHDWLKRKARTYQRKNSWLKTIDLYEKQLDEGKHIRWVCGACGAFIKEIKKTKKSSLSLTANCKNGHFNQFYIDDHGGFVFRGNVFEDQAKDIFKNPKE